LAVQATAESIGYAEPTTLCVLTIQELSMYLMRIGPAGSERPVVRIDDLHYIDVADVVDDFNEAFFGSEGLTRLGDIVRERGTAGQLREFTGERIGAPIARPHQILCIGLNYSDHAAETGAAIPEEPIFSRSRPIPSSAQTMTSVSRAARRSWTGRSSWGVVIGRRTSYLDSVADAHDAIAGYLVVNDVSERAFQIERGGQWSKGKSAETFNPAGPLLVTPTRSMTSST
jgi:2-keto-4-pentenoate hydratase/2-oxohepta-3-ene-1,7-dioic acid hydratase in catechol pathway